MGGGARDAQERRRGRAEDAVVVAGRMAGVARWVVRDLAARARVRWLDRRVAGGDAWA